jgi:hypothetical protein
MNYQLEKKKQQQNIYMKVFEDRKTPASMLTATK